MAAGEAASASAGVAYFDAIAFIAARQRSRYGTSSSKSQILRQIFTMAVYEDGRTLSDSSRTSLASLASSERCEWKVGPEEVHPDGNLVSN